MSDTSTLAFPLPYGKYELLEQIGDGGMAEVFRARMPGVAGFEKTVVIKRILPHLLHKKQFVDMFVAEATLAAQVQHRNVVQVFELAQHNSGEYFIVMEYVEGTDLRRLLRAAAKRQLRIPPWFSLHIVIEILEALAHAHSLVDDRGVHRNIVHRDVTPSNVFLSKLGEAKLGDFGVAHDTARTWQTQAGQLKGKVAYMAPEQLYSRAIDQRTDLFAIGVVLWECLTQRRLFGGGPDIEVMNKIVHSPRRPVTRYAADVPKVFDALLQRAVAVDPAQRFQSAAEMQSALLDVANLLGPRVRADAVRAVLEVLAGRAAPETAGMGPLRNEKRAPSGSDSYPPARSQSEPSGHKSFGSYGTSAQNGLSPIDDPLYYQRPSDSGPVAHRTREAVNGGFAVVTNDLGLPGAIPSTPTTGDLQAALSQPVTARGTVTPKPNALLDHFRTRSPTPAPALPPVVTMPPTTTTPGATPSRPSAWSTSASPPPRLVPPLPATAGEVRAFVPPEIAPKSSSAQSMGRIDIADAGGQDNVRPNPYDSLEQLKALTSRIDVAKLPEPAPAPKPRSVPALPEKIEPLPLDAIEMLVNDAVDEVRALPEAQLEVVPRESLLAGLDIRRHASRVSDLATKKWAAFGLDEGEYNGTEPFWLRDNDGAKIGPCDFKQAIGIARAELRARLSGTSEISADGEKWMSLRDFAQLVGMESMLRDEEHLVPTRGVLVGSLGRRSLASVFGILSRNRSTGRLVIIEQNSRSRDYREIELIDGRPTYVYANDDRLQLPDLLVAKKIVPTNLMPKLVRDAIIEQKTLTALASSYLASDLSRYRAMFMKERLVDLFGRETGSFTFDESIQPEHKRPFCPSLIGLLPELVHRSIGDSALSHSLRKYMDVDLRPSESLGKNLDEMGLTRAQLGAASLLANGRRLSALLRQWPDERRLHLTMAYVMIETELLKPV